MALTLYIETNFVVGIAKGQDPEAAKFLEAGPPDVRVVIPGVCFMEALSVWKGERKEWAKLSDKLSSLFREATRNLFPRAKLLAGHLERSRTESEHLHYETEARLNEALYRLAEDADHINLDLDILKDALGNEYISDPTDNLILCSILRHARLNPVGLKAFFSNNHNDFSKPLVRDALRAAKVRYFKRIDAALGWLRSQPASEPEG